MRRENWTIPGSSSGSRNHCPVAAARSASLRAGFEADGLGAPQAVTARTAIKRVADRIRAVGRMANLRAIRESRRRWPPSQGLDGPRAPRVGTPWISAQASACAMLPPMTPATPTALRTLRFGHSPDADDAFMFYGFHTGNAAIAGCHVEHVLEDIQTLNRRALDAADLEITAVSAHAYARLAGRYAVMRCGASLGMGYGPVVVARERRSLHSLRGRPVAVPGPLTT